ncbi:hypothetical protein JIG36_36735 [Actinoplanes sp. LDG1-06]|uniref:Uncharacterized protein n=1 Tax=Paractinoplanes ovalisporus TaxID=2810368 RepID=A0ABS2AMI8_9ACTN|nr:hypothetical protein [Actinoplanes ovalisporus]MBM2621062.1 hypothetical protein [Actinoplanes ovalisporus]
MSYPFPAPAKKRIRLPYVLGGVVGGLVLCLGGVAVGAVIASPDSTAAAEPSASFAEPSSTPTTPATTTPTTPPPTTKAAATAAPTTKAPKPKPITFKRLSAREWKKIAKTPDDYIGKTYVVYGVVTQFDAATGPDGFRADADGVRHRDEYDYDTNSLFLGDAALLADLVEDDQFVAKVTVAGSYSYDTQIGGSTTAPQFYVASIQVL